MRFCNRLDFVSINRTRKQMQDCALRAEAPLIHPVDALVIVESLSEQKWINDNYLRWRASAASAGKTPRVTRRRRRDSKEKFLYIVGHNPYLDARSFYWELMSQQGSDLSGSYVVFLDSTWVDQFDWSPFVIQSLVDPATSELIEWGGY